MRDILLWQDSVIDKQTHTRVLADASIPFLFKHTTELPTTSGTLLWLFKHNSIAIFPTKTTNNP